MYKNGSIDISELFFQSSDAMDIAMERITRATLKLEESSSSKMTKKSRNKKKVKFEDSSDAEHKVAVNLSLASDEGIDMSFSPISPSMSILLKPRHPLPNAWTFWYSAGDKRLSWKQNQKKISTVGTVEDFWVTYNQVKLVSGLPAGYTYSVFRAGILPDWEEVSNRDGGRWMVSFSKTERKEMLDNRWLEILYMLMGEHVEEGVDKLVTGAEACVRKKGDRLEVWVGDITCMRSVVEVGRMLKKKLKLGTNEKVQFSIHEEEKEGIGGPKLML